MTNEAAMEPDPRTTEVDKTREWKIYSFLVSVLAVALAFEVLRLRMMVD